MSNLPPLAFLKPGSYDVVIYAVNDERVFSQKLIS